MIINQVHKLNFRQYLNFKQVFIKKQTSNYFNYLTPKVSFRANPKRKNVASTKRTINNDNIFLINRLGLEDSFEVNR